MEKKLSEMSLEELWKLFPIYLTEHQPYWKEWYTDEESFLKNRVPKIERISHIVQLLILFMQNQLLIFS